MKHVRRMIHTLSRSGRGLAVLAAAACVMPAAPPDRSPADPHFELRASDARGLPVPLERLPRRPEFALSSTRAFERGSELLVFEGPPDPALQDDLADLPLRAAHDLRRIAGVAAADTSTLSFQPIRSLLPDRAYTLALPGSARLQGGPPLSEDGPAFVAEVRTAPGAGGGAGWLGSLPADGAAGVPPNLHAVLLALDGNTTGAADGVWLEAEDGLAWPARVELVACAQLDSRGASCLQLTAPDPLEPAAQYRIRSGRALRDAHGAPVEPLDAVFTTGVDPDLEPPGFEPLTCLSDELAIAVGCALLGDDRLRVRASAREPIRLLARSGQRQAAQFFPGGAGVLELHGFAADEAFELELRALDLAGNASDARLPLRTAMPLPTVSISEVQADPAGPEPAQEYVELHNYGPTAIALEGFGLVDATDARPSLVEGDVVLPAGARALLVADAFDPMSELDLPPPPGTRLIRVGARLTRAGLANAGERLILRDALGRRLSAVAARPAPGSGQCLQRSARADPRSDAPPDFTSGRCTPGR